MNMSIISYTMRPLDGPLHIAIKKCHIDAVRLLLAYGADVNKVGEHEYSPLLIVSDVLPSNTTNVHMNMIDLLCSYGVDPNPGKLEHEIPLHMAVKRNNLDIVRKLCSIGADINCRSKYGSVVLEYAICRKDKRMANLLLELGADVDQPGHNNNPLLCMFALWGWLNGVIFLLDNGANINAKNPHGHTALNEARRKSHQDIVNLLIRRGAIE